MKSRQFEEECNTKIGGWLWDQSWSEGYQEEITLTITEMREIAALMRLHEGRHEQQPRAINEDSRKRLCGLALRVSYSPRRITKSKRYAKRLETN